MTKVLKVTIVYLVHREVEVIADDNMTLEQAAELALVEDTKIYEPMTPQMRAVRETLSRAELSAVTTIEDVTPVPGKTPGVCSHGYDMEV